MKPNSFHLTEKKRNYCIQKLFFMIFENLSKFCSSIARNLSILSLIIILESSNQVPTIVSLGIVTKRGKITLQINRLANICFPEFSRGKLKTCKTRRRRRGRRRRPVLVKRRGISCRHNWRVLWWHPPIQRRGKSTLVRAQNRIVSSGRFRSLLHRFYASTGMRSGNVSSLNNPYQLIQHPIFRVILPPLSLFKQHFPFFLSFFPSFLPFWKIDRRRWTLRNGKVKRLWTMGEGILFRILVFQQFDS